MTKITKVTGVKKAIGDYKKGTNGFILYNMAQKVVYYEELPDGTTTIPRAPSLILLGYKMGEKGTGDTMASIKSKVTSHYLAREELEMSTYHYADRLVFNNTSQADPRVVAYKKYLKILSTDIF